jgi:DNA primase
MRLLVTHPALAAGVDKAALDAAAQLAPDNAAMLTQLLDACRALGEQANFAALAEQLRGISADFDPLIAEIAADTESDADAARLELAGAVRQTKMQVLKAELERLATAGLASEDARNRYRELMQQQEQLRREAEVENVSR